MLRFVKILMLALSLGAIQAQPYPYGNPVVTNRYTADAAPHVMPDGRAWMVTSIDHPNGGGYSTMHAYHTFSSDNMVDWVDHGEVLHLLDFAETEGEDWALWAPDVIFRDGWYYLYIPIRIAKPDGSKEAYIAVARSERMDKRFTVINPKMEGTVGIDPSVFIDDDDQVYMYWGSRNVARLKDNMMELAEPVAKLELSEPNFMEAAWMHKRNGTYYFNYHTLYEGSIDPDNPDDPMRKKSRLDYYTSPSPTGPFTYRGVLNYELGVGVDDGPRHPTGDYVPWRLTQSNHGGVLNFHGQDYLFYHTSALSSFRQSNFQNAGTWTQRSVCIDSINYANDGTALPVRQSINSVDPVTIDQPFAIGLDWGAAEMTGAYLSEGQLNFSATVATVTFPDVAMGSGYYYLELGGADAGAGKVEVHKGDADGPLLGTIRLAGRVPDPRDTAQWSTFLREADGQQDLTLVFSLSDDPASYQFATARLTAGSPSDLPPSIRITRPVSDERFLADAPFIIVAENLNQTNPFAYDSVQLTINEQFNITKTSPPFRWTKSELADLYDWIPGLQTVRIVGYQSGQTDQDRLFFFIEGPDDDIYIQAEDYTAQNGLQVQPSSDAEDPAGGRQAAFINNGDWAEYSVTLPQEGTYNVRFRYASGGAGGTIRLLRGNLVMGEVNVDPTGGWSNWRETSPFTLESSRGTETYRLEFINTQTNGFMLNLNWWALSPQTTTSETAPNVLKRNFEVFPNPAEGKTTIKALQSTPYKLTVVDLSGRQLQTHRVNTPQFELDLGGYDPGIYLLLIEQSGKVASYRLFVN